jgi:catechol 2,3-dioxygenase-like lactoylglutathione lyase family enzyme
MNLLVNIDVDNLEKGTRFYCNALGLRVGRRFEGAVELLGLNAPIYLLEKPHGTQPFAGGASRDYDRHWTPVHLDFEAADLPRAVARAMAAGAALEQDVEKKSWGRIAMFSDPFGNGFCLIEFTGRGYDAIAPSGGQ